MPIDITLEKRCIKYLWNLINSKCKLYNNVVDLSLNNVSTTIAENMRYFMYKYIRFKNTIGMNRLMSYIRKLLSICCRISMRKFSVMRLS